MINEPVWVSFDESGVVIESEIAAVEEEEEADADPIAGSESVGRKAEAEDAREDRGTEVAADEAAAAGEGEERARLASMRPHLAQRGSVDPDFFSHLAHNRETAAMKGLCE